MNKLILIGNGFDLAHKMPTGYKDFIVSYFKNCIVSAAGSGYYNDEIVKIANRDRYYNLSYYRQYLNQINEDFVFDFFNNENELRLANNRFVVMYGNVSMKNSIVVAALKQLRELNWVDIEQIYYDLLLALVKKERKSSEVVTLNASLRHLTIQLEKYLSSIESNTANPAITKIIESQFNPVNFKDKQLDLKTCNEVLFLNFNYTNTVGKYADKLNFSFEGETSANILQIHGELNNNVNPIIFGFGDEMDDQYKILEKQGDNVYLDFMKSFGYFRTNNHKTLIQFLEKEAYQVEIMGHSCGLSDRVLLNTVFEHHNCKAIKVYYYQRGNSFEQSNYKQLTQNISRHFNKKSLMRDIVVDYENSIPLPQL